MKTTTKKDDVFSKNKERNENLEDEYEKYLEAE